ncbi:hypothetical protein SAMN04490356_0456 [Streptomyces melanosporofaciens]|uniref:Uncharacterized protein n=1 Tax=Streptomyces melanosporofaciens TaxID=67327 RepID=A0A1H4IBU4_STRMJ|nr:hypothetical protein SAMN04490356_0456 [Streptomyces melanosporofaciens]
MYEQPAAVFESPNLGAALVPCGTQWNGLLATFPSPEQAAQPTCLGQGRGLQTRIAEVPPPCLRRRSVGAVHSVLRNPQRT